MLFDHWSHQQSGAGVGDMRRAIRRERMENGRGQRKRQEDVDFMSNGSKSLGETQDDEFITTVWASMSFSSTSCIEEQKNWCKFGGLQQQYLEV